MNKPAKSFISIKTKLLGFGVILNILLVLILPSLFLLYLYNSETIELNALWRGLEGNLTARGRELMDPLDMKDIERTTPRILNVPEVKYTGVFDSQNKLIFEVGTKENIERPVEKIIPVHKGDKYLGAFRVIVTEKLIYEQLKSSLIEALIFIIVQTIIVLFFGYLFLKFFVLGHVEQISSFIKNFDASKTTYPEKLQLSEIRKFKDEFDLVAEEINLLATRVVKQNIQDQKRYNIIESEVIKRTDALLQAKQKADKAGQEKVEFISSISHEIRNPINAILGFSEILNKELKGTDKMELISPIVDASSVLLALVNDLLDISKVESGKLKIEMSPTKSLDFIKSIERTYRPKIEERGLNFIQEVDENFPKLIKIDLLRLSQVIANLLENSLKFTADGYIKLSYNHTVSKIQNKVNLKIAVEDSGKGIPKEDWAEVFEKYRQVKGQSYQKYQGAGLGLSICKKITHLMGGDINIIEKSGKGSLFVIELPDITLASLDDFKVAEQVEEYFFEKAKILVVEDEKLNQDLIKWNLRPFPIEVLMANNGKEGINMALMHKPDLIIMDIMMPNMDGIEAIQLIKVYENLKKIPIVVITALAKTEEVEKVKGMINGMLRKPVLQRDLYAELAKFLPHKKKKVQVEEPPKEEIAEIPEKLKKGLKDLFEAKILELKETMSIGEGRVLAEEIDGYAKDNKIKKISVWAAGFKRELHKFNVKEIKSCISEFQNLIS